MSDTLTIEETAWVIETLSRLDGQDLTEALSRADLLRLAQEIHPAGEFGDIRRDLAEFLASSQEPVTGASPEPQSEPQSRPQSRPQPATVPAAIHLLESGAHVLLTGAAATDPAACPLGAVKGYSFQLPVGTLTSWTARMQRQLEQGRAVSEWAPPHELARLYGQLEEADRKRPVLLDPQEARRELGRLRSK